jgi:rhodanese-related sulfurtransferase
LNLLLQKIYKLKKQHLSSRFVPLKFNGGVRVKAYTVLGLYGQKMIVVGLVAVLLLAFVAVPQAFAQTSESGTYENISVEKACKMMKKAHKNLVILDVRNQSEYDLGHLYDAVLIPVYELENRINELQEHTNDPIIVYCKAGSRSQIACEILASHGFTKVYNMVGGITAWIEAGYPICTTYHYVTADVVGRHVLTHIEPILLHQTNCTSCGCKSCAQTCPETSTPSNIEVTRLEQDENHTTTIITYEVNGTTYRSTITETLLWNYIEVSKEINRTVKFVLIEVTSGNIFMRIYSLSYIVQHKEYNITVDTTLTPLNPETYKNSFIIMDYAPAGKSEIISMELAEFNSSISLSQQYAVLGKVAKEMGNVYKKSGDKIFMNLAKGYYTMENEAQHLSRLIKKQLQEYDRTILSAHALISDRIAVCAFPTSTPYAWVVFYCLNPLEPQGTVAGKCCAPLYAIAIPIIGTCTLGAAASCISLIIAAIFGTWAALTGCRSSCPSMQVCYSILVLGMWLVDVYCTQAW